VGKATAMAAVQRDQKPQPQKNGAALWVVVFTTMAATLLWLAWK
jgi:hypothetical protein